MSSVALKDYENATFNGFTKHLRPKMHDLVLPEYAGFYFRTKIFRDQVNSMFNNAIKQKFELLIQNLRENMILTEIRETLLPKLMSGEIRVPIDRDGEIS